MMECRVNRMRAVLVTAGFLGLAACAPEPGESPQSETPAASVTQSAAGATENRVNLAQCQSGSDGKVHFKVGDSVLAVPAKAVGDVIPTNMKPPFKKEQVRAEIQNQASQGAGCPERPLEATLLVVKDDFGHPLLEGTMGLVRTPPKQAAQRFANLTAQLQAKPNRNCKTLAGELLACVGTETRGERDTPVMYVISTDTTQKMNTGGPLAVRCLLGDKKIQGCNIVDQMPGGLTFDASLNAGDYSTALLRGARDAVVRKVRDMQR